MTDNLNREAFREEAYELLSELESALLELEKAPEDDGLVNRVFRALHTIKGSGAMFGFDDLAAFAHEIETAFDMIRNGTIEITKDILSHALSAMDHIQEMLDGSEEGKEQNPEQAKQIIDSFKVITQTKSEEEPAEDEEEGEVEATQHQEYEEPVVLRIRLVPDKDASLGDVNIDYILDELESFGKTKVIGHYEDIPFLEDIDESKLYIWWDVYLTTTRSPEEIEDIALFVGSGVELSVKMVEGEDDSDPEAPVKKIGEILVDRGDVSKEDIEDVMKEHKPLGQVLTESGKVTKSQVDAALAEQETVKEVRTAKKQKDTASSIRVAADKLDLLVDLVGELVIVQAQISQLVSERSDPTMTVLAEELERLSDELRDSTLGIRMLPIGTTFSKFRRLVRDLSNDLGKEIELKTSGAETELDKTVIERLNDPLVHLIRNSIDHGVEPPEVRVEKGKKPAGTIMLSAEHSGGDVLIQIVDDGKGIDAEAVRNKAIEKGVIAADAEISDKEIYNLIFHPGFSTAQKITSVSGRGVGMDVVKRAIDSLRGSIIVDSTKDVGTTMTVKLPLTLAIIDGLQVMVGDSYYVLPLSIVEECVELTREDVEEANEQQIINLRGEIVPYIRLRELFHMEGNAPSIEQIVITGTEGKRTGIVVDNVIGEHQTVIKSLGRVYRDVEGISGATIKGDGTMALILDVPKLVQLVLKNTK